VIQESIDIKSRIFQEDQERKVWQISDMEGLHGNTFLVKTKAGDDFLLYRKLYGRAKYNLIQKIAKQLFLTVIDELKKYDTYRQFIILRGAYPFDLQKPSRSILSEIMLPTTFLKLQRVLNKHQEWIIKESFFNGSWEGEVWLIPDTAIASGSTIAYLLEKGFENYIPKLIVVFTAAGSFYGMRKIATICRQHNVELIAVFSSALFEVSQRGILPDLPYTDLPLLGKGTITTPDLSQRAQDIFQGKKMCSVGDVGDSLENPFNYLINTLREISAWRIDVDNPDWLWVKELFKLSSFQEKLEKIDEEAYRYFKDKIGGD
jgi:hypothetical protein